MSRTTHLRNLRDQLRQLEAEHDRQRNCPSRGYNEDAALAKMCDLGQQIDAELDLIDSM